MSKNIVYGICGIGNGHIYRQIPIIEALLAQGHRLCFFAYGNSLEYLQEKYASHSNVCITQVCVPYYIGDKDGLDFVHTASINSIDFNTNLKAFSTAQSWLGKPELVITDYEPFSAQYGYAYGAPVVSIDQQSKFFTNATPLELCNTSYMDEVMRLRMFFPLATRIACSFFQVARHCDARAAHEHVTIVPPILRDELLHLDNQPRENHYIVYISAQAGLQQPVNELLEVLKNKALCSPEHFHLFVSPTDYAKLNACTNDCPAQITIQPHGHAQFESLLKVCSGIITTAGHSLISESLYLGIPVYALPLKLYEQQINALMIEKLGAGLKADSLSQEKLDEFINHNGRYRQNIQQAKEDGRILTGDGLDIIMNILSKYIGNT